MKARAPWILPLCLLVSCGASAEDAELRAAAVQLLEKANAVSTPAGRIDLEERVTFRAFAPLEPPGEGEYSRVVVPNGERLESSYGSARQVEIHNRGRIFVHNTGGPRPGPAEYAKKFVPIILIRFDHEDTIREIVPDSVRGRAALCIKFDTAFGSTIHHNEACVDKQMGALLRFRDDREVSEYSDFFQIRDVWWPARIDVFRNGLQILEMHHTASLIEGPVNADVLAAPPGSVSEHYCSQYRRPFVQNLAQPAAGRGSENTDILLHAMIGLDGKILNPVVVQSDRPDLNQEALQTVSRWTFLPALCDGEPTGAEADIIVHFIGR